MMFDLIIRNGLIIDGTGRKAYANDIGINGEFITAIGNLNHIHKQFPSKDNFYSLTTQTLGVNLITININKEVEL